MQEKLPQGTKGMTLIELLVTIAIIAVLVGVSIGTYTTIRKTSQQKAVENLMRNARVLVTACLYRGQDLNTPDTTAPIDQPPVCGTGGTRWPELPGGWQYVIGASDFVFDASAHTFTISAQNTSGQHIVCDAHDCVSS